jgi:hypothetical protein
VGTVKKVANDIRRRCPEVRVERAESNHFFPSPNDDDDDDGNSKRECFPETLAKSLELS